MIHEKGFSKGHKVTTNNLLGGTSEMILKNFDDMLKKKPSHLTVYDLANEKNLFNQAKKIVKKV